MDRGRNCLSWREARNWCRELFYEGSGEKGRGIVLYRGRRGIVRHGGRGGTVSELIVSGVISHNCS